MSSSTIPLDDVNLPLANFAPATAGERSATFSTGAARGAYMTRRTFFSRQGARLLLNDYQRLYRGGKERHPIDARQTIVGTRHQRAICVEAFACHIMYIPLL